MSGKQDLANLPRTLSDTLEKDRPEYEALLRRTRWGEGPVYVLGAGTSWYATLSGAYSFEVLAGWPVVARSPRAFAAYSLTLLKPSAVVVAISSAGETRCLVEVARAATARGASLLALTSKPESALAKLAGGVFRLRTDAEGSPAMVCEQAVMSYLGLLAARIFRKHQPQFDLLEQEFRDLPERMEWALAQMPDAIRSLAVALLEHRRVWVLGGGFYFPSALQAADLFRRLGIDARALDMAELGDRGEEVADRDAAVLTLSGSRCRLKKDLHEVLRHARQSKIKVFAVTDSNDAELVAACDLTLLLPCLAEPIGAILAGFLIHCVAEDAARSRRSAR